MAHEKKQKQRKQRIVIEIEQKKTAKKCARYQYICIFDCWSCDGLRTLNKKRIQQNYYGTIWYDDFYCNNIF